MNGQVPQQQSPEYSSSWWSRLVFSWVIPTIRQGCAKPLDVDTLLPLNAMDEASLCHAELAQELAKPKKSKRPLLAAIFRLHRPTLVIVFIISLGHLLGSVGSPLLLRHLLTLVSAGQNQAGEAYLAAFLLFASALLASFTAHHLFHIVLKLMIRVRSALIGIIYDQSMALSLDARQKTSSGHIINLMGTDTNKFVGAINFFFSLWMHPLQILLVLFALYYVLGSAALAGASAMLGCLASSILVSRREIKVRAEQAHQADLRVGLMSEILNSMRVIKLYSWELSFAAAIGQTRDREAMALGRLARLSAVSGFLFQSTPVVATFVTFWFHVRSGGRLTSADVFSALALFTVLRHAMVTLPNVVSAWLEANVAARRIEDFLHLTHRPGRMPAALSPGTIVAAGANVQWTEGVPAVRNLDFVIQPGELVVVVGAVGAGKSALLLGLLGDLAVTDGSISASGSLAYVPQQAWIVNDTVRENILFGRPYDATRYQATLAATALEFDLSRLLAHDQTELGERGVNLSGGQKQRIGIARACYDHADIVLLDDPLSALDHEVAGQVFSQCVQRQMAGRTRILVTHRLDFALQADRVLVVDKGLVVEQGSPHELEQRGVLWRRLWASYQAQSGGQSLAQSTAKTLGELPPQGKHEDKGQARLVMDEERQTGGVDKALYLRYLKVFAPGSFLLLFALVFVAREAFTVGTDAWLGHWAGADMDDFRLFLYGYALLALLACSANLSRSLFVALRGLAAGTRFHGDLLKAVMAAPLAFFDATPVGRVLNRFSRDMESIDRQIPSSLLDTLACLFTLTSTILVIVIAQPVALVLFCPVVWLYWRMQRVFRPTSREAQRLDAVTRSPIFAHFSQSLQGVQVIRAYGALPRFQQALLQHTATNSRAFYTMISANRWLGIRIETLGAIVVGIAALAVLSGGTSALGLGGLGVTYALSITGAMNWAIRAFSNLESCLNSVERVDHYSQLDAERWEGQRAPEAWPQHGEVRFRDLTLTYRPGLPNALTSLTATIRAGEKVGVIGRTGAGKSSLLVALFRLVEAKSGCIEIDGIDIGRMNLSDLRSRLAIIPQDPVLFHGTIRFNLDPFAQYSDAEIWQALGKAAMQPTIAAMAKGLLTDVFEGGMNLSVGQKQLLCLARAILRRCKVLLLDEATANVDAETDAFIHRAIRDAFPDATVIIIAHRLGTVMDADRVMLLDAGRLVAFAKPQDILVREKNLLASEVKPRALPVSAEMPGTFASEPV